MPDDTATTETAPVAETTATAAATTVADSTPLVNTDGTLADGWHNQFVDEEHRKDTSWLGLKSISDLTGRISHLQGKLTTSGKGFFPINENSTPEQVNEFRKEMNIPDKPEGYDIPNVPPEVKDFFDFDAGRLSVAKEALHKANLSKEQYTTVMTLFAQERKAAQESLQADPVKYFEELWPLASAKLAEKAEADLKTRWGDAYQSRLDMANRAIQENVSGPEEKEQLLKLIGNNPAVADFFATVYNKHFTESHGVDTSLGTGVTHMNVEQRIEHISSQLTTELKRTNRKKFDELMSQRESLYKQRYPENKAS
jgi:hypothetical protein